MTTLTEDRKRDIMATLLEAGAVLACPRCGEERFEMLNGYILEFTQNQLRNMVVGSHNRYATIATVCSGCGFVAQHALKTLGITAVEDANGECKGKAQQIFQ